MTHCRQVANEFDISPFVKGDPLWMPFGDKRNNVIERLIALKNKYPNFVVNGIKQSQYTC